jgi:Flp pilus assembly protein TadD
MIPTRLRRPGSILMAACLVAPALVGCQTARARKAASAPPAPAAAPETPPPLAAARPEGKVGLVRADFKPEVSSKGQVELHLDLARIQESQGRPDAALAEYRLAVAAAGHAGRAKARRVPAAEQALAHRKLAGALDRLGQFAEAEAHYKTAQKLTPGDPKVWNDAGYSLYLQGRWADAQKALKTAAKLAPSDPMIQTNLGLALAASGQVDAALEALTRAGGGAAARANLAYVLAATGQSRAAREQYRKALELQPQLDTARLALAQLDADAAKGAQAARTPATTDPAVARTSATGK